MYIYKAGVVGAGAMGAEIAQVISFAGIPVVIKDLNEEILEKAMTRIKKIYQSRVDKGKMEAYDMEAKLALISTTTTYDEFKDVDIVIEAVYENMEVKKKVFSELDEACPKSTILATNTSALSITEIASATKRPEKVIGMHFFNPAHVMKLVEVIPGLATSSETVEDVLNFSESLRKIPLKVKECPGFLVNRILMPYLNECAFSLQEGEGTIKEIDEIIVKFGFPMGPFTLIDMLGIDICNEVAKILYNAYGERMRPAEILEALVKEKRLGQKTNAGFYEYDATPRKSIDKIIDDIGKKTSRRGFNINRPLFAMINEAIHCVQENIATPSDIEIAVLAGIGFPQDKQGILHFADSVGLDVVLNELEKFTKELGIRFWPSYRLKMMVSAGWLGVKTKKGFFTY
jgi:3-hydroxyacyl-CoA dehydrogenase